MTSSHECGKCGSTVPADAKFCTSCGTKVEVPRQENEMTAAAAIEYLQGECQRVGDSSFSVDIPLPEGRSQVVFALVFEDEEGDAEYDDITIWSNFAAVNMVNADQALDLDTVGLGVQKIGEYYSVQTSIRPSQLKDVDSISWIMVRVAIAADLLEQELFGTDSL